MARIESFEDFDAYIAARAYVKKVYTLTRIKPLAADFVLRDQMRGALESILSNFAEGFGRQGRKEFIQFLSYANGSLAESRAKLHVMVDQEYLTPAEHESLQKEAVSVGSQIGGLMRYLGQTGIAGSKYQRPGGDPTNLKPKTSNFKPRSAKGAAIISVLLVLTVLTIMVVAFLQSMRIDRLTARAYLNKTKAEMLAKASLEMAMHELVLATKDATSENSVQNFVTESQNPTGVSSLSAPVFITQYQLSSSPPTSLLRKAHPIISGAPPSADFESNFTNALQTLTTTRQDTDLSVNLNYMRVIQDFGGSDTRNTNFYRAPLEDVVNSSGNKIGRIAYLALDEQARLNPEIHLGKTPPEPVDPYRFLKPQDEVALTLEDDRLMTRLEFDALIPLANNLPQWTHSQLQYFSSASRSALRRHFFGMYSAQEAEAIPGGLPDAGLPKSNINNMATNNAFGATAALRAEAMASLIDRNLPNFKLRDPSFVAAGVPNEATRYLKRLSASMVDYIDTDDDSTTANISEPAGRDLFPMVTGVAENFQWLSKGIAPTYICTFQSRYYAQIWNPYTTTVTGNVRLLISSRPPLLVGLAIQRNLADYDQTVNNVTVRPNETIVVEFPIAAESIYQANVDPDLPTNNRPRWDQTSSTDPSRSPHPYFKLYWNNKLADMNRHSPEIATLGGYAASSGLPKGAVSVSSANRIALGSSSNRWSVHFQQLPTLSADGNRRVTDPRINWESNYDWTEWLNTSYTTNARWGGIQNHSQTSQQLSSVLLKRDPVRADPNLGVLANSTSQTPKTAAASATYDPVSDARNAPFYIRNGPMVSIGELGNIFDPAQASDAGTSSPASITAGPFSSGGGRSLRIGQPEFNYWNTDGKRAIELLDLFTINPVDAASGFPLVSPRVNINTASVEVLAALLANIDIRSDVGQHQDDVSKIAKLTPDKALLLAQAIVDERNLNGPYRKSSDLHRLASLWNLPSAFDPALGSIVGGGDNSPMVMDRAREEFFSKFIGLVTLQSRTYRIYTTGLALNPQGSVVSRSYLESVVELQTVLDLSGKPRFIPHIIYQRFL